MMKIDSLSHRWNVSPKAARAIQDDLRPRFREEKIDLKTVKLIAGADAAYSKLENRAIGVAALFSYPDLILKSVKYASKKIAFPYVPGLLTFREGPAVLAALDKLEHEPDVIIFDGQGYAHPRRLGLASHLGILLDKPTIGVAKTVLVGHYEMPGPKKGSRSPLLDNGERIGIVLRTRDNVAPVFISVGQRLNLNQAVKLVLDCCSGYRLPEPARQAHLIANKLRRK